MIIVSYDIANDKLRTRFSKMLTKNGAIRLQFSVYEVLNSKRLIDVFVEHIQAFGKHFKPEDSVVVFFVDEEKTLKFGNAIHRDKDILFFD